MKDKQIIDILTSIVWDLCGEGKVAVATLINNGIPANIIAEYYGRSETAELMQKAKENDLID